MSRSPSPRCLLFPVAIALAAASVHGQSVEPAAADGEPAPVHWAFAPTFGTGIYQINDVRVFIVRAPFRYTLIDREEDVIGLKLLFPLTVGVHDFDIDDILAGEIPTTVQTLTFTPGVQAEVPVGKEWILRPSTLAGVGLERKGDEQAFIYTGSLEALRDFSWGPTGFTFMGGASYHGFVSDEGKDDNFSRLSAGLDVDRPLGWSALGCGLSLRPHGLFRWYVDRPDQPFLDVTASFELGLSLGFEPDLNLLGFGIGRIGLAYSVSQDANLQGIRILFGTPF